MSIVFLLSSLPTLEPGGEAPLSVEEYRSRCECISSISLSDFDAVATGAPGSHPFTVAYSNALAEIKNATALFRASKWEGQNIRLSERSHSGYHVSLRQKIAEACSIQNPFERELALSITLWKMLEELAGMAYFSKANAYAYIVKLQINSRLASLSNELGRQAIEEFIHKY
jgi:hypothetical protein